MDSAASIIIGVSHCLLGESVRYDGGHKCNSYITETLAEHFEFHPICPEVAAGLGIPREPIRLEGDLLSPRVVSTRTRRDLTAPLQETVAALTCELTKVPLCGFLLKKDSPSCGMERVKLYNDKGMPVQQAVGLFARALQQAFPLLPMEEEGRLKDPGLRENFIERVFVFHRWQALLREPSAKALVEFHTRHKFLIMAHSPQLMRQLGTLVAGAGKGSTLPLVEYGQRLMEGLKKLATPKKNSDVLMHLLGFLKNQLSPEDKQELLDWIEAYRIEQVPLIVPLTLFNHHIRRVQPPYLADQWYLRPHPMELKLRNHV